MIKDRQTSAYYIQVVKEDEEPEWPVPESELIVGSQDLGGGFSQFWAYPQESGKEVDDIPPAEKLAGEYHESRPVILIDQKDELLELVLIKDAHAWAHSTSSLDNLEDNVSEMLDYAKRKFDFQAEHFMTTERVSGEAEEKLNALEKGEESESQEEAVQDVMEKDVDEEDVKAGQIEGEGVTVRGEPLEEVVEEEQDQWNIRQVKSHPPSLLPNAGRTAVHPIPRKGGSRTALTVLFPIVLVGVVFTGLVLGKEQILGKLRGQSAPAPQAQVTPTSAPLPTAVPTPAIDRVSLKIRVLNGTTKTGAAAELGEKLESLGWQVLSVGNAPKKGVERTIVRVKKESGQISDALSSDLSSIYSATVSADLKDTDKADAEVVIGLR